MVFEKETNLYQDAAIRSKFASQDTQFSVIQGKISYLITDSEIATYDDGKGTITSRMNSAEDTVDRHTQTISSMQEDISNVDGNVERLESNVNTFEQTTGQTFSRITSTIATKTHVFRDQPTTPYNEGDFWIKDKELYVCVNSKEESESYSAADWIPSTKGRVFTTTPTVPYNAGDMWMQGSTGDIKICTATRTSGSYSASDWSNASRYIGTADITTWYNNNLKDIITGLEDGEVSTYYQTSDPSGSWTASEKPKHEGDIWYNSTSTVQKYYRYNGSSWDEMKATPPDAIVQTVDKKANIYTGSSTPSSPKSGDLWFKGADQPILTYVNNSWQVYNKYTDDSAFTTFRDGTYAEFVLDTGNALNTKTVTYYQASAPTTHNTGDLWIDTDDKNKLYRWNGTTWQNVQDAQIQDALTNAATAKSIADRKIVTFAQASQPSGTTQNPLDVGDLWIDTDDNNKIYRYSGSAWTPYTDSSALNAFTSGAYANFVSATNQSLAKKITTFYQSSTPSGAISGDLWIDTGNGNILKRYSGSSWTAVQDVGIQNALNAAGNAQATADGKIMTYAQASAPSGDLDVGDLWIETDNNNRMYRWSGSSWVPYTDTYSLDAWVTTTYDSFIDQLPDQINIQVTGTNTNPTDYFTAKAQIIADINTVTQQSQVAIRAEKILIEGDHGVVAAINGSTASISAERVELSAYSKLTDSESMSKADYIGSVAPTLNNYPASTWADNTTKSAHIGETYYNKTTKTTYYFNGVPTKGLLLTFDSRSATEPPGGRIYDYVQIFYVLDGKLYKSKQYTGTIGSAELFIPSGEFWVYWHTDNSGQDYYGFSFSSISTVSGRSVDPNVTIATDLPDFAVTEVSSVAYVASTHNPYAANADKVWKYTHPSSVNVDKTFSWTQTEIAPYVDAKASVIVNTEGLMSKVSAGEIASTINQTAQGVLIDAQKINLNGYLTVTDVGDSGSTVISGSRITTGSLSADRVTGGTLAGSRIECSGGSYKTVISNEYNGGFIEIYARPTITSNFERCGIIQGNWTGGTGSIKNINLIAGTGQYRCVSIDSNGYYIDVYGDGTIQMNGNLQIHGSKSRIASTDNYGERILYCYETPSPLFGDVGEGTIGDDGMCYIFIEPIFAETISLDQYQVFLQKYGDGECYISERKSNYFVVCGTCGLTFGWEIKAKQLDFNQKRLDYKFEKLAVGNVVDYMEEADRAIAETETIDYAEEAINHINEIAEERKAA